MHVFAGFPRQQSETPKIKGAVLSLFMSCQRRALTRRPEVELRPWEPRRSPPAGLPPSLGGDDAGDAPLLLALDPGSPPPPLLLLLGVAGESGAASPASLPTGPPACSASPLQAVPDILCLPWLVNPPSPAGSSHALVTARP